MLMALNVYGMSHGATWNQWVALAVQLDLLVTGLAGWCPMAMTCRVADARLQRREERSETN
jgi:hypothetical protein